MDLAIASTTLCFLACITWLACGTGLLLCADTCRARPAFVSGLGLVFGGALLGLGSAAMAGPGGYPLAALILGAAMTWTQQSDDEANGLQRGDRLLPVLLLGSLAFVLHALGNLLGVQPTLVVGLPLRPFDLPVVAGLVFLWLRARQRPATEFWDAGSKPTRDLLWATAGATLAGFLGGDLGQAVGFLLLAIAPLSLLVHLFRADRRDMARITAIAATCTLAFSLLLRTDALQTTQQRLLDVVDASCALDVHYARTQAAVDVAMDTSASEEPQLLYDRHRDNLTRGLAHLAEAAALLPQEELALAVHNLGDVVATHHRWCRDALQALSVRSAAWGDAEASGRAELRARSAHQESRLGYQRGLLALESLRRAVVLGMQRGVADLRSTRSTMLALIVALALLGLAFSLERPGRDSYAEGEAPKARLHGRVLIVDESPARRSLVQDVLAQSDAELDVADSSVAVEELINGGHYDLVLLDMLFPGIDAYATARRLLQGTEPTPVVAMSGERAACLAAGCAEHLASPIHPDALRAVLERHLQATAD